MSLPRKCYRGTIYLITHGEASIIRRRTPQVRNEGEINEIHQVQPPIEQEPSRLPVLRNKIGILVAGETKGVDEEETEDHQDAGQDAPPQFLVHHCFDGLFALRQAFDGEV